MKIIGYIRFVCIPLLVPFGFVTCMMTMRDCDLVNDAFGKRLMLTMLA